DPGTNSGFMVAQYTAAALVTENRLRSFPASVESLPTSAGMEDHVSMGVHAAHKLVDVVGNTRDVLAIEALCAAQGLDLLEARAARASSSQMGGRWRRACSRRIRPRGWKSPRSKAWRAGRICIR